jgi:hypothetical protein
VCLQWSETTGQVPLWALAVDRVLNPQPDYMLESWVHHGSCVQHCLEVLNLCVYLLIVLRKEVCELVNDHP